MHLSKPAALTILLLMAIHLFTHRTIEVVIESIFLSIISNALSKPFTISKK